MAGAAKPMQVRCFPHNQVVATCRGGSTDQGKSSLHLLARHQAGCQWISGLQHHAGSVSCTLTLLPQVCNLRPCKCREQCRQEPCNTA